MLYVLQDRPLQLLTITEPHHASALSGGQKKRIVVLMVNFPRGQWNLMGFFHNDANNALITKIALKFILDFEKYKFKGPILLTFWATST